METTNKLSSDYEAIVRTLQYYIDASLAGKSQLMQAGFHTDATIYGYYRGNLVSGSIGKLYDLIDGNGPAPDIQPQVASIEIMGTIAVARLEVAHWTGPVIGSDTHMTDFFTLVKTETGWKISHKSFYMHV